MEITARRLDGRAMKKQGSINKNSFDGSLQTKGAFFRRARYDLVQDQINASVKKYIDSKNNSVYEHLTEERPCQVCGSLKRRILFHKNYFPHVRCLECAFVYVNPILKEEELIAYYGGISGSWADMTEKEEYNVFQNQYYRFQMENIQRVMRDGTSRTLLDIGCNNGEFLTVAQAQGWEVTGHELNTYAAALARKKGIEVFEQPFSAQIFAGRKFGAVTLLGVLEHLPHPGRFLEVVHGLLQPGGVLATLVPNIDSIVTRLLQEKCNTFDGIEHVNFWNKDTFERFLLRYGFRLAHAETTISEIYTLNNYLYFEHPYACPEEYPLLLDGLTPEYVHQRFMGHHLCCYANPA